METLAYFARTFINLLMAIGAAGVALAILGYFIAAAQDASDNKKAVGYVIAAMVFAAFFMAALITIAMATGCKSGC